MSKRKRGDGETKAKSSYQTIGGKKYDRGMISAVDKATEDKDKINIDDCKKLFVEVIDGDKYTQIEKDTMKYIRENYKFENDADQWIRRAIASWAATKAHKDQKKEETRDLKCSCNLPDEGLMVECDARLAGCYTWYHAKCVGFENKDSVPEVWFCDSCKKKGKKTGRGKKEKPKKESYYKQIDNKKYDKGMLDAADAGVSGKGDGRISIGDAKVIFKEAVDGDKITECEYDTLEYIKKNYTWTGPATTWLEKAIAEWENEHPRKKARAPRAAKEKKEKKEEKKGKGKAKGKGKPKKKKAKKDEEEEEGGDDEGEEDDKKENGQKSDA